MFYVYLLYSRKLDSFYLGSTRDLRSRFGQHGRGEVRSTKKADDWIVSYYEAYPSEQAARRREAALKRSGKAYQGLKLRVRQALQDLR